MKYFRAILLLFFISPWTLSAQQVIVTAHQGMAYPDYEERIDYLIMMKKIDLSTEISVLLPNPSLQVEWYRYSDMILVSNQKSLVPDDHTGYIARINGMLDGQPFFKELTVWVIDYSLYQPILNELQYPDPSKSTCSQLSLELDATIPTMYYETPNQLRFDIERLFMLEYETLTLQTEEWVDSLIVKELYITDNELMVDDPPLKDTYFTLKGDAFALDLELAQTEVQSAYYQAIRVFAKIKSETTVREVQNEGDSPDDITALSGSAPLDIHFTALTNGSVADYFRWEISKDGEPPFIVRTGDNYRYTFNEAGTFQVKLQAENRHCQASDSLVVRVSESGVYAPNAFSPNGDGINDEFRVAYKSIVEFDCWIFNRWGQQVYHWTDPQKGWDGNINGRPAAEGAYFYVIRALGADGMRFKLKGDISLIRGNPH